MTSDNCITAAALLSGEGKTDTKRLLEDIEKTARERSQQSGRSYGQELEELIEEVINQELRRADRKELQLLAQVDARSKLQSSFYNFKNVLNKTSDVAAAETLASAGASVNRVAREAILRKDYKMKEAGVERYYLEAQKDRKKALNIFKELAELEKTEGGQPGLTGDAKARKVADIVFAEKRATRERQKKFGIEPELLSGRVVRRQWDRSNLIAFGTKDDFVKAMFNRIDRSMFKTGASDAKIVKYLRGFYDQKTKGDLEKLEIRDRDLTRERMTFPSRQDLEREIVLKTADDELFVLENFGRGNLPLALTEEIEFQARQAELVNQLGVNPRNNLEQLKRVAKRTATERQAQTIDQPSVTDTLKGRNLDAMLNVIDRGFQESVNPDGSEIFTAIGNTTRALLLDQVVLSALPDLATVSRAHARVGAQVNSAIATRMEVATQGLPPQTKKMLAGIVNDMNAYNTGALMGRFTGNSFWAVPANVSTKIMDLTFKIGGQVQWTKHNKAVAASGWMSVLSRNLNKEFDSLDRGVQAVLVRGQINKRDWERLRSIRKEIDMRGKENRFVALEKLQELDPDLFSKVLNSTEAFVNDAVPTPGVREQSIVTGGSDPRSLTGALYRAMTMFLSYPITYMTRQMAREVETKGARAIMGSTMLAAQSLFAGYVTMVAKDYANNTKRDYFTDDLEQQRDMLLEATVRGGTGGLLGSVMIDSVQYGSPVSTVLGAPAGQTMDRLANDIIGASSDLATAQTDDAAAESIKILQDYTPFVGLPFVKPVTDQLVFENLLEMVDPGTSADIRRQLRSQNKERILDLEDLVQ